MDLKPKFELAHIILMILSLPNFDREYTCAGSSLLAAGYCLYSSSILFVLTVGNGVWGFTYDNAVGEFILTHPEMKASLGCRVQYRVRV